jgi:hypothetical protein
MSFVFRVWAIVPRQGTNGTWKQFGPPEPLEKREYIRAFCKRRRALAPAHCFSMAWDWTTTTRRGRLSCIWRAFETRGWTNSSSKRAMVYGGMSGSDTSSFYEDENRKSRSPIAITARPS